MTRSKGAACRSQGCARPLGAGERDAAVRRRWPSRWPRRPRRRRGSMSVADDLRRAAAPAPRRWRARPSRSRGRGRGRRRAGASAGRSPSGSRASSRGARCRRLRRRRSGWRWGRAGTRPRSWLPWTVKRPACTGGSAACEIATQLRSGTSRAASGGKRRRRGRSPSSRASGLERRRRRKVGFDAPGARRRPRTASRRRARARADSRARRRARAPDRASAVVGGELAGVRHALVERARQRRTPAALTRRRPPLPSNSHALGAERLGQLVEEDVPLARRCAAPPRVGGSVTSVPSGRSLTMPSAIRRRARPRYRNRR